MRAFKSEISNGRIVALALERKPLQWLIGKKVYDPEKIRVFLEAVWSRISVIDRVECMAEEEGYYLLHTAQSVTTMLKTLKNESDAGHAVTVAAEELFAKLKALAAAFLTLYFRLKEFGSSGVEGFRSAQKHQNCAAELHTPQLSQLINQRRLHETLSLL